MNYRKTVFVGLSGGVDSAVSAAILKDKGYDAVGVFIRTWHPDFLECNKEEERRDAMRVAAHLDIPFLTFDLEKEYKKGVADYMVSEYKAGRTPNPDVMCNREVKFGAFLKKALAMGADYVATGHYARVRASRKLKVESYKERKLYKHDELYELLTGRDSAKDQSYFLWTLNQKQLSKIIFPVGGLEKSEVRKLAEKFKLPVSAKKDSQGICFLGEVDLKEFLKHYIKTREGKVLNTDGQVIGYHDGVVLYTLGERHGFTITKKSPNDGPYYVVAKDIKRNTLVVAHNKLPDSKVLKNIRIKNTNWISSIPNPDKKYMAQIRYHGEFLPCSINCATSDVAQAQVVFDEPVLVASGQSIVIYDKDVCLGGGVAV